MQDEQQTTRPARRIHRRRLQRPATASGYRVDTFREVIYRHGGTMGLLALAGLLLPGAWEAFQATTEPALVTPRPYLIGVAAMVVFFIVWSARRPQPVARQVRWVLYLLFISIVEEVAFRLTIPLFLGTSMGWLVANVLSNLVFAGLHYVTLRWKLRNCIVTFLGGMGLSQLLTNGDLTLVIMVHWVGTFLNTPFPPHKKKGEDDQAIEPGMR
ncbi:MAG: CPBP family intramembrane metalloprotease [Halioglobus sp.]|nr:CPBP family intramembrane metalloprotease [Halioglobus sp.]